MNTKTPLLCLLLIALAPAAQAGGVVLEVPAGFTVTDVSAPANATEDVVEYGGRFFLVVESERSGPVFATTSNGSATVALYGYLNAAPDVVVDVPEPDPVPEPDLAPVLEAVHNGTAFLSTLIPDAPEPYNDSEVQAKLDDILGAVSVLPTNVAEPDDVKVTAPAGAGLLDLVSVVLVLVLVVLVVFDVRLTRQKRGRGVEDDVLE